MKLRDISTGVLFCVLALPACDPTEELDAGTDTGATDAGRDAPLPVDAPVVMTDTGMPDTGVTDTGVPEEDAGMPTDGGGVCATEAECPTALSCLASGSCGCPAALALTSTESLQISEIVPGMYIELFNAGTSAINLGTSGFEFCSPFVYGGVGTGTLAPGAYITVPWPSGFTDTAARGEVILYRDGDFGNPASIMDFVCWGTSGRASRQSTAETAGRWSGACAPAITGGAIHRLTATNGTGASSYSTSATPTGATCAP
jgi:hypothetical protein